MCVIHSVKMSTIESHGHQQGGTEKRRIRGFQSLFVESKQRRRGEGKSQLSCVNTQLLSYSSLGIKDAMRADSASQSSPSPEPALSTDLRLEARLKNWTCGLTVDFMLNSLESTLSGIYYMSLTYRRLLREITLSIPASILQDMFPDMAFSS